MKASETLIETLRAAPSDAVIASHKLTMQAGLIKKLANGLYAYTPMGLRAFRNVERIIREELDKAGLLEIKAPFIQPAEIWKESGRYATFGDEMLRMKTRGGQEMIASPTAEEAFVSLVRDNLVSYKQLPFILYQINTKYRDEIRPRYGVMRGREFVMMDAYSFDADEASLDRSYEKCSIAYKRIFKRLGISVIPVRADTGAMGGSGSEEFMVESEVGDNTLILCKNCGYAANVEKAKCAPDEPDKNVLPAKDAVEKVSCPGVETISQMEAFFKMSAKRFIKVLIYKVYNSALDLEKTKLANVFEKKTIDASSSYYPVSFFAVAIRGDLDVNETKLAAVLKASAVELADESDVVKYSNAPHGFVGPVGLDTILLLADESVMTKNADGSFTVHVHDAVTGAGEKDFDFKHVEPLRDFMPFLCADLRTAKKGDCCAECGGTLYAKKGNELGHIFKLGKKYTDAMHVSFLDENGKSRTPLMGCYGIGLDRTLASIIEEHHDEHGIIWTMSVAPYTVCIVPIKYDGKAKEISDKIYDALQNAGLAVLLDDRAERAGVKFADMDLLGFPIRIVVGEKNLPNVEVKMRSEHEGQLFSQEAAISFVQKKVSDELAALNA